MLIFKEGTANRAVPWGQSVSAWTPISSPDVYSTVFTIKKPSEYNEHLGCFDLAYFYLIHCGRHRQLKRASWVLRTMPFLLVPGMEYSNSIWYRRAIEFRKATHHVVLCWCCMVTSVTRHHTNTNSTNNTTIFNTNVNKPSPQWHNHTTGPYLMYMHLHKIIAIIG
jgi:hypothetical protein